MRKSTKLPDGVGKKIIEALKSQPQSAAEIQMDESPSSFNEYRNQNISENRNSIKNRLKQPSRPAPEKIEMDWEQDDDIEPVSKQQQYIEDDFEEDDDFSLDVPTNSNQYIDEDDDFATYQEYRQNDEETSSYNEYEEDDDYEDSDESEFEVYEASDYGDYNPLDSNDEEYQENFVEEYEPVEEVPPQPQPRQRREPQQEQVQHHHQAVQQRPQVSPMPDSNVNTLINLVHQLPTGVTKQTGAQIIRQTMEAMGIPMNKVLNEAQFIQDELAKIIKDNINTIEEYRNNIKSLEKDVQAARNKCEELDELIGLFTLNDM